MSQMDACLSSAIAAAREAGQILLDLQGHVNVREKSPADLVTEADLAAQSAIERRLSQDFPDFYFIGEESEMPSTGAQPPSESAGWIVDPLDGTTNFVHGFDNFCVSIALRRHDRIELGVIYDPNRDRLYHAVHGAGAFANGQRLQVSGIDRLDQALVAASFSARVPPNSPEVKRFVQVLHQAQAMRRLGSAALNLCYVAEGKLDAYWATSVQLWDVGAGLLCVTEAGGAISAIDGGALNLDRPQFLASSSTMLHGELLEVLRSATS